MKKVIFLVAVMLLVVSTGSFAQAKFGLKAGVNFANQDWSSEGLSLSPDSKTGLVFGGFVNLKLSDDFALQPELLYASKGTKFDGGIFDSSEEMDLKMNYLSVPVMAKYYFGGFNLQAGPTFDFLLSADVESGGEEEDVKDEFKGMDLGLGLGLGYELPAGLSIDARYILGLSDISDSEDMDGVEIKNKTFQVTVGFSF
ncbi:porin family protein [Marinilabilia salmonicolor]|uniref:porin family protein n=1 Tax=Marinilabilia salmonicolor TaxID=989 RepID=UPI00029AC8E3|nr:porin family protein [Marinilabilia salmonicolor]